jgi:chromate transporter
VDRDPGDDSVDAQPALPYGPLFLRFLRFGFLAWGGPVAQIAMLRRELVDEEHWLPSGRFNRLLAVYQVLPGPEAHELAVHLGMLRGGRVGGILAGLGFMLPGFGLMFALSWLYFRVDIGQSALGPAFLGIQVAVIAVIVRAIHRIGGHVLAESGWLWPIATGAGFGSVIGVPFWITLPAAGLAYLFIERRQLAIAAAVAIIAAVAGAALIGVVEPVGGIGSIPGLPAIEPTPAGLFLSGLKAGLLTFGGAYTAIPFLREDAVASGWMTDARFLDGLALSGILPAPLIIFSTFVGYVAGGPIGAVAMTLGIFLPAFSFSLLLFDRLEAIVEDARLHALLEGVAAGVVGLIVATALQLSVSLANRLPSLAAAALIFAVALAALFAWRSRMTIPLVIVGAGIAGSLLLMTSSP